MSAVAVTTTCPACREPLAQRIYLYARAYLCAAHQREWDVNDERAHRNSKVCPHFPKACERCAFLGDKELPADVCGVALPLAGGRCNFPRDHAGSDNPVTRLHGVRS